MDAEGRRRQILEVLKTRSGPVSASRLAEQMRVSRQIIVGDIALLRAQGCNIVATARGYLLPELAYSSHFVSKVACQHSAEDTVEELYTIVDAGAQVLDVIVEHGLYGEMSGQLNLSTREDVDAFIRRVRENRTRLLSELTGGVHLHTVSCRDSQHFQKVCELLAEKGMLYKN